MNKRGTAQTIGIGIVLGLVIFIIGMASLNIMKPEVTRARGVDGLNCINASNISDATKLTCLAVDFMIPAIIWGLLSMVAGVTITRLIELRRRWKNQKEKNIINPKEVDAQNILKGGEGKVPVGVGKGSNEPMNFHKADARKWRPAQNKGKGQQGGYWGKWKITKKTHDIKPTQRRKG